MSAVQCRRTDDVRLCVNRGADVSRPLFSVVIPTIGRSTLPRTLDSIPAGVEVIVVVDTHEMSHDIPRGIGAYAQGYGFTLLELDAGRHDTGSPQIAYGFGQAHGRWLLNCDDDDVYEPDAFDVIARAIETQPSPRPLMFRVELHPGPQRGNTQPVVLPVHQRIERFNVTGQSFVCPNDPERLGAWVNDWTFMQQTVANYGGLIDWRSELIARCY